MRLRKKISLYIMAALYIVAGILHFVRPATYYSIMPSWLPYPMALVYISGVVEIIAGLMLLPAATRHLGAWLVIALLIAVFPANVQMMINYYLSDNPYAWITVVRLPLQFMLIWWAWKFTKRYPVTK